MVVPKGVLCNKRRGQKRVRSRTLRQGLKGLAKGSLAAEARRGRGRAARFLSALAGKRTALSPVPLPVFPDGEDAGKKEAFLRRMCCMAPEIGEGLWRLPGFGGSSGCDRLRDIVPFSGPVPEKAGRRIGREGAGTGENGGKAGRPRPVCRGSLCLAPCPRQGRKAAYSLSGVLLRAGGDIRGEAKRRETVHPVW